MKKETNTMKNIMNKVSEKVNALAVRGYTKGLQAKEKIKDILAEQSGEGFVDTALVRHVSI